MNKRNFVGNIILFSQYPCDRQFTGINANNFQGACLCSPKRQQAKAATGIQNAGIIFHHIENYISQSESPVPAKQQIQVLEKIHHVSIAPFLKPK